jgi:hypothetical protein
MKPLFEPGMAFSWHFDGPVIIIRHLYRTFGGNAAGVVKMPAE